VKTGHKGSNRDLPQIKALCDGLMVECRNAFLGRTAGESQVDKGRFDGQFVGKVKAVVPERSLGFIEYGQRQFQFALGSAELKIGQRVRFRLKQLEQRTEAFDVTSLN
jgi:hypothetical protein